MAISRETTDRIRDLLKEHPEGLSITGIVSAIPLNRNTISRYLDTMLVSGQVEMHHFGMAKIYTLAKRLPVSSVLSISSEYVLQVDGGLRVVFLNEPFLTLLDLAERDVLGKKIDVTRLPGIFADEYPLLLRWISEGLSGIERRGEIQLPARERILACRVSPAVFSEGQKGVTVLFEDITAQRHDEARIRESEEKFRTLAEVATDGIMICDPEGLVIEWNAAMGKITGLVREQVIGSPGPDMILRSLASDSQGEGWVAAMRARLRTATRTGTSQIFFSPVEATVHPPGGGSRVIRLTIFPVRTSRGTLIGAIVHDITSERLDEKRLRESEERYRTLVEISPYAVILHRKGIVLYVNPAAVHLLGATGAGDLVGKNILDYVQPQYREAVTRNIHSDLQGETTPVMELDMVRPDGTLITVEGRGVRTFIDGEPAVQVALQDITERKRAGHALRKSEARLRSILRAAPVGIGTVVNRVITEVNDLLCEMTGYTADELRGQSARILYHDEEEFYRVGAAKYEQIRLTGRGSVETRWQRKDGTLIDVLLSSSPLIPGTPAAGVTFTALDITSRKRAEADLIGREHHYRFLVENSLDIINVQSPENVCTYVSPSVTPVLGYTVAEVLGKPLLGLVHPDDLGRVQDEVIRIAAGGPDKITSTFRFRHKDGRYLWFESTTNVIRDERTGRIREYLSISRDITTRRTGGNDRGW